MTEIEASIDSLHKRFHQSLMDLKEITDKPSRQDHIDYMTQLWKESSSLYANYGQQIHPITLGKLLHILSSPIPNHVLKTNLR